MFYIRKYASNYLHSLLGILIQGSSLALKDGHIRFKEVLPLHTLLSGHWAHQDGCIQVLEGYLLFVSGYDLCRRRKLIDNRFLVLYSLAICQLWTLRGIIKFIVEFVPEGKQSNQMWQLEKNEFLLNEWHIRSLLQYGNMVSAPDKSCMSKSCSHTHTLPKTVITKEHEVHRKSFLFVLCIWHLPCWLFNCLRQSITLECSHKI